MKGEGVVSMARTIILFCSIMSDSLPTRKYYLSIDDESTGSSYSNPIVAIGIFFGPSDGDMDPKRPGAYSWKKRWALQPLANQYDEARCMVEFWAKFPKVMDWIKANAVPAAAVMIDIMKFCSGVVEIVGEGNITLISDCPDYDIGRINHLGHITGTMQNELRYLGSKTRHSLVDPSERLDQMGADDACAVWMKKNHPTVKHTHFPDDDAEEAYWQMVYCKQHAVITVK
jgi:hypothetical protein